MRRQYSLGEPRREGERPPIKRLRAILVANFPMRKFAEEIISPQSWAQHITEKPIKWLGFLEKIGSARWREKGPHQKDASLVGKWTQRAADGLISHSKIAPTGEPVRAWGISALHGPPTRTRFGNARWGPTGGRRGRGHVRDLCTFQLGPALKEKSEFRPKLRMRRGLFSAVEPDMSSRGPLSIFGFQIFVLISCALRRATGQRKSEQIF